MSDDDAGDEGLEAGLRWLAQQVMRSAEQLEEEIDFDAIAKSVGIEAERARGYVESAMQWLTARADDLAHDAATRFGPMAGASPADKADEAKIGPHPLDLPTDAQGMALSAVDSGRWKVKPGSSVITGTGEGPAPSDALGLVGELRARDWINAAGEVTVVGHNALKRWISQSTDSKSGSED